MDYIWGISIVETYLHITIHLWIKKKQRGTWQRGDSKAAKEETQSSNKCPSLT